MTTIRRDTLWATVEGGGAQIERLLRFKPKGFQFAPSYQKGQWDGWIKLTRTRQGDVRFPAGLLSYVLEQPWAQDFEVIDGRNPCVVINPDGWPLYSTEQLVELDARQEKAVQAAVEHGQGIIQYPTGTGKGRIIGEVVRRLNTPTLILVDKVDLLHQLRREVEQATGQPVGIVGGREWMDTTNCVVATFQTIARRLRDPDYQNDDSNIKTWLQRFVTVITDEGHHAEAKTYAEVLEHCPAYYRLAFSATAFKSYAGKAEDKGTFLRVQAWIGPPIASMTISEGVDTGRIVPADVFIIHGCDPYRDVYGNEYNRKWAPTNYREEVTFGLVNNFERNDTIGDLARKLSTRGPTVVLVDRIEHGNRLHGFIGLESPFVHGNTTERQRYYEAFKRGELSCLIISKIADEGLDLPNIEHLILAGGGNAPHKQIQRIGRALRASPGKERAMIFDFEDYGKYIAAHYRRRRRTYLKEPAYNVVDIERSEI